MAVARIENYQTLKMKSGEDSTKAIRATFKFPGIVFTGLGEYEMQVFTMEGNVPISSLVRLTKNGPKPASDNPDFGYRGCYFDPERANWSVKPVCLSKGHQIVGDNPYGVPEKHEQKAPAEDAEPEEAVA